MYQTFFFCNDRLVLGLKIGFPEVCASQYSSASSPHPKFSSIETMVAFESFFNVNRKVRSIN